VAVENFALIVKRFRAAFVGGSRDIPRLDGAVEPGKFFGRHISL
jgi:hypothetical protein